MIINLNYFKGEFHEEWFNVRELKPFTHVKVVVNCDEPISSIGGPLERRVESFLNEKLLPMKLKCHWDHESESIKRILGSPEKTPQICRLEMGVNIDF